MENYQIRFYPEVKGEKTLRSYREIFLKGVPLVHKTLQGMPHSQEYIDNKKQTWLIF